MDFSKVEEFVRAHWPAALMVTIIVAPSIWGIASLHYSERMALLDARVLDLSKELSILREKVAVLDQAASRKLVVTKERFTAEELFTPSPAVKSE